MLVFRTICITIGDPLWKSLSSDFIVGIKGLWFVNHKSFSWSHQPKFCKTSIFHESFFFQSIFLKYQWRQYLSVYLSRFKWTRLMMKENNSVEYFSLFWTMLKYINKKSYKNIACIYFVNIRPLLVESFVIVIFYMIFLMQ